jgi:serine/threonine-protein kinase
MPSTLAPADPLVGRDVAGGRYRIESLLGRGGMGTVYRALQRPIDRIVVLKLIHRELAGNPDVVARFHREVRITASLEHPHTVRVYDSGEIDGQPFLATEFLDGQPLTHLVNAGPMNPHRMAHILVQVARALRAAHARAIIHRDLKPDNIMVVDGYGEKDFVKVLDFGIARSLDKPENDFRTVTGAIVGTPAYMSPEQCDGQSLDARTDLYSLGVIAFQMASGRLPFPYETLTRILVAHVSEPVPDLERLAPHVPLELVAIITALLAKKPAQRPASAEELIGLLEPWAGGTGSSASTESVPGQQEIGRLATLAVPVPPAVPSTAPATAALPSSARGRRTMAIVAGVTVATALALGLGLSRDAGAPAMSSTALDRHLALAGEPPFPGACASPTPLRADLTRLAGALPAAPTQLPHLAAWPASAETDLLRARAAASTDQRLRLAEQAVASCANSAVAQNLLGKALTQAGRLDEAGVVFRRALVADGGYLAPRFNLGVLALKQGDHAAALDHLGKVAAADPGHPDVHFVRAQAHLAGKDFAGAEADLRDHLKRRPDHALGWQQLGELLQRRSDAAARDAFCKAKTLGHPGAACPE